MERRAFCRQGIPAACGVVYPKKGQELMHMLLSWRMSVAQTSLAEVSSSAMNRLERNKTCARKRATNIWRTETSSNLLHEQNLVPVPPKVKLADQKRSYNYTLLRMVSHQSNDMQYSHTAVHTNPQSQTYAKQMGWHV